VTGIINKLTTTAAAAEASSYICVVASCDSPDKKRSKPFSVWQTSSYSATRRAAGGVSDDRITARKTEPYAKR